MLYTYSITGTPDLFAVAVYINLNNNYAWTAQSYIQNSWLQCIHDANNATFLLLGLFCPGDNGTRYKS